MQKLMKPEKLSLDPNSFTASKEWKHWKKTFQNYLSTFTEQNEDIDKLKVHTNYLSFEVYDYVDECETYDDAEACLEALFVKKPNEVFARYCKTATWSKFRRI